MILIVVKHDGAAGAAHVNTDHFKAAMARLSQLLADVPEIVNVEVPGDGWSRLAEVQLDAPGS